MFLSADTTDPLRLVDRGLVDGRVVLFAGNELTIITPTDNPAGVTVPTDLARDGLRVVAARDGVPLTRYATQLIENIASQPGARPDFAAGYAANVVSKEDSASAVRTKIELGEGDAALVYATDAAASEAVETIPIPDEANATATYAGVVVAASRHRPEARAFLEWMADGAGQGILADLGFLPPAP